MSSYNHFKKKWSLIIILNRLWQPLKQSATWNKTVKKKNTSFEKPTKDEKKSSLEKP